MHFKMSSAICFNLDQSKILSSGYGLFTIQQNSRLDQIMSILRRQNRSNLIVEFCLERVKNIVGKRRKCWLPALSPFPTMFLKASFSRSLKVWIVC